MSGGNKLAPPKKILRQEEGFGMNLTQGIYFWMACGTLSYLAFIYNLLMLSELGENTVHVLQNLPSL